VAIGLAEVPQSERAAWSESIKRECKRYGLDEDRLRASLQGTDPLQKEGRVRSWPELLVTILALGIFVRLAFLAQRPVVRLDLEWLVLLSSVTLAVLAAGGVLLWRCTHFS
jgi:hypothetical protein